MFSTDKQLSPSPFPQDFHLSITTAKRLFKGSYVLDPLFTLLFTWSPLHSILRSIIISNTIRPSSVVDLKGGGSSTKRGKNLTKDIIIIINKSRYIRIITYSTS